MTNPPTVHVGIGAFLLSASRSLPSNPCFLIGKRKGSHGSGTYALPGGHLEFGESPEDCACRELWEETGLKVKNVKFLTATNDAMVEEEGKHYITMFMTCEREDGAQEARNVEVEKCEGWEWVFWSDLVKWVEGGERRVFLPLVNLIRQRPGVLPGR